MAIMNTFSNRGTTVRPIKFDENVLKVIQRLWTAHLYGLGDNAQRLDLPKDISTVIKEVNKYIIAIPLLPKDGHL
jgi:hypothetical protein